MRNELKRIEALLTQLAQLHQPTKAMPPTIAPTVRSVPALRAPSFMTRTAQPLPRLAAAPVPIGTSARSGAPKMSAPLSNRRSPGLSEFKVPTLPRIKAVAHPQHPAKPALAAATLSAIKGIALGWQEELQQRLRQIQDVYAEGPIVDAWLEAYVTGSNDEHMHPIEANNLINVAHQGHDRPRQVNDRASNIHAPAGLETAGYRLCGFNNDGQLWFRHCPAEQVAAVSLAIARCERMKHLLTRKQHLEAQLGKLAEALTVVYEHIAASGAYGSPLKR